MHRHQFQGMADRSEIEFSIIVPVKRSLKRFLECYPIDFEAKIFYTIAVTSLAIFWS